MFNNLNWFNLKGAGMKYIVYIILVIIITLLVFFYHVRPLATTITSQVNVHNCSIDCQVKWIKSGKVSDRRKCIKACRAR